MRISQTCRRLSILTHWLGVIVRARAYEKKPAQHESVGICILLSASFSPESRKCDGSRLTKLGQPLPYVANIKLNSYGKYERKEIHHHSMVDPAASHMLYPEINISRAR